MDIKAMQAEAQTKATAWLTTNLPVEEAAPIVPPIVAPSVQFTTPPTPVVVPVEPTKSEAPAIIVPSKPGLADAIRRDRDARVTATTTQTEYTKTKGELEALRKENESLRVLGAANDPFDFLRGRKLTKEQQALWGQAFLYDLKPEVAPQEFRLELYKAEQARKEAAKVEADQQAAQEQARQAERAFMDRYANELVQHIQSSPGSNPESELWFSEEAEDGTIQVNHKVYAQSLFATADNLARQADKIGQQANLSPANVAKVLEAEVSKRLQRRDAKRASSAKTDVQAATKSTQSGTQATNTTTTTSAQGLRSGAPLPPGQTDEERRARAAAILFGTK